MKIKILPVMQQEVDTVWQHLSDAMNSDIDHILVLRQKWLDEIDSCIAKRPPTAPWPKRWVSTVRVHHKNRQYVLLSHFSPEANPEPHLNLIYFTALLKIYETDRVLERKLRNQPDLTLSTPVLTVRS